MNMVQAMETELDSLEITQASQDSQALFHMSIDDPPKDMDLSNGEIIDEDTIRVSNDVFRVPDAPLKRKRHETDDSWVSLKKPKHLSL